MNLSRILLIEFEDPLMKLNLNFTLTLLHVFRELILRCP